jgi:hypothetical protein
MAGPALHGSSEAEEPSVVGAGVPEKREVRGWCGVLAYGVMNGVWTGYPKGVSGTQNSN